VGVHNFSYKITVHVITIHFLSFHFIQLQYCSLKAERCYDEIVEAPDPRQPKHVAQLMHACASAHIHGVNGHTHAGTPSSPLAPLTEPLCGLLYDQLRPAVVLQQDLDELCELVDVLKHEVGQV
jgi:hypothetical protein